MERGSGDVGEDVVRPHAGADVEPGAETEEAPEEAAVDTPEVAEAAEVVPDDEDAVPADAGGEEPATDESE